MRRVAVAEEVGDSDGAVALCLGALGRAAHGGFVERLKLGAVVLEAAGDADDVFALDEWFRLVVLRIVEAGAWTAGDVVDVLDPLRCQQQHPDAASFEERVEALGRTVDEEIDVGEIADDRFEAAEHARA